MTVDRAALDLLLDGVEGYLHPDEPTFLAGLAAQVQPGQAIVEIGSYRGRSTIALAYGAQDGVIIYAVDPHDEHEVEGLPFGMADNQAFMANVSRAGMGHKIRAINLEATREVFELEPLWSENIGLFFVDGAHDYESVKRDVELCDVHLREGGLLALHDSSGTWVDPTRVADELAAADDWTELESCAYTRVFRKEAS